MGTREEWNEITRLFHAALAIPASERAAFISRSCQERPGIGDAVRQLLEADRAADDYRFLTNMLSPEDTRGMTSIQNPPQQIRQYRIVETLGRGGMGVVYLAQDTKLGRRVALKLLSIGLEGDPSAHDSIVREARNLASLNHPNIATLYEVVNAHSGPVLVMEYVPGETLRERLSHGPLQLGQALCICAQIAAALEIAHGDNLIHCDLKPSNIKITPDGCVKLLDFGVSRILAHETTTEEACIKNEAMAQSRYGTPGYMSRELILGKPVAAAADIFALGCILYECLTGRPAFEGSNAPDRIAATLRGIIKWERLPSQTPHELRELLHACLESMPESRTITISNVRRQLVDLEDSGQHAPASQLLGLFFPRDFRRRRSAVISVIMLAVITLLIFATRHLTLYRATPTVAGATIEFGRWPFIWRSQHISPVHCWARTPWQGGDVIYGLEAGGSDGGSLVVRHWRTGRVAWSARPNLDELETVFGQEYAEQGIYRCEALHFADIDGDTDLELVAYHHHKFNFPCFISAFEADGEILGTYYHPGLFDSICLEDIDRDGRVEIILAGTTNVLAYQGATLLVLDGTNCHGAAVDCLYNPTCNLHDVALARVIFPNYDSVYMELLECPRLVASDLSISRDKYGNARINAMMGCGPTNHTVILDANLNLLGTAMSDALVNKAKTWPDDAGDRFLSDDYQNSWLSRHYRYLSGTTSAQGN